MGPRASARGGLRTLAIKHDAFISYSHRVDSRLASAMEDGLEKLAKPLLQLRAIDVFRDETSLAASSGLWTGLVDHLTGTDWMIVLASPEWASSPWCPREALWWLENKSADRMLFVVVGGDIVWDREKNDFDWTKTTALSRELSGRFREEPLYVDLRWARGQDGLTLSNLGFRDAILSLSAPIRGIRKDELDGADVRQLRRNRMLARAAVAAIMIFALLAVWQAYVATQQRDEARRQTRIAIARGLSATAQQKIAPGEQSDTVAALMVLVQAMKLEPDLLTKSVMLSALQKHPSLQRLLWADSRVNAVEFSPDGSRLASAGEDGGLAIWDPASGKRLRTIPKIHENDTWSLAFLPDGRRVVTASLDKTAAIWDADTGQAIGNRLTGHADQILGVAVSPNGQLAATACLDGSIWLWNLERQEVTRKLTKAHERGARTVAFSRDGSTLVSGGFDGTIKVWRVATGEPLPGPRGRAHEGTVLKVAFNSNGSILASAGEDGVVERWDTHTWKPVFDEPLDKRERPVLALAFNPDGEELAAAGEDNRIVVWRPGKTKDEASSSWYSYHKSAVWQVAYSPDGSMLAAASSDGSISLWNKRGATGSRRELMDFPREIHGIAFHPKNDLLALGAPDGRIFLHSPDSPTQRGASTQPTILQGPKSEVLTLLFSPSGNLLASATLDDRVVLWDVRSMPPRQIWTARHTKAAVFSMAFAPDESVLVSAGGDGSLIRWDARSGAMLGTRETPHLDGAGSASIAFHPNGKYFASAGRGLDVILWDGTTGKRLQTILRGGEDDTMSGFDDLAISPDGRTLIAATGGAAYVWRDEAWSAPEKIFFDGGKMSFSRDSRILAVGGRTARLLDIESFQVLAQFEGQGGTMWGLAFNHDNRRLATSSPQYPAMLWSLDERELVAQACRIANRELERTEWRAIAGLLEYQKVCPSHQ